MTMCPSCMSRRIAFRESSILEKLALTGGFMRIIYPFHDKNEQKHQSHCDDKPHYSECLPQYLRAKKLVADFFGFFPKFFHRFFSFLGSHLFRFFHELPVFLDGIL